MAAPQNQQSEFILISPNWIVRRPADDASIWRVLFFNQFLVAHPQPQAPLAPQHAQQQQQQNLPQNAVQQQLLQANLDTLDVLTLEQILVPLFDTHVVRVSNTWSFHWLPGANPTNIHHPTVPIPKTYASFKNVGVHLCVPSNIRVISTSRAIFNFMNYRWARDRTVVISNCYLSKLVTDLNRHKFFKQIVETTLRGTREMDIHTGRYHRLESRITDFSRYCESVRRITFRCGRGCEWVENPVTHQQRVVEHLSYTWRPHGFLVGRMAAQDIHFKQTRIWPAGLERIFRRYLYLTAEWRNARGLLGAIRRKRVRANERHPIRMTFEIEFMAMRTNHMNAFLQYENHGGFTVTVSC